MNKGNILIVEDEDKLRLLLNRILSLEDYKIYEAANIKSAWSTLGREDIHVILCDVKLPDGNGIDFLNKVKSSGAPVEVIILTAFGTIQDGVKAMKMGAFDYIIKGDGEDQLIPTIARAMEKVALQNKILQLEEKIDRKYNFNNVIGDSRQIQQAIMLAKKVAVTDTNILLLGETGTGKEIFAQAIHHAGPRRLKSYVAINCSAISKDLLESEMFGYKAGAFTGALKDKKGLFEEAHEGTIFLDEIGEMNLELQAKILRVLESMTFIKPGDTKTTKVNVRIIAATNKDLVKESENNSFRADLYYRLSAFSIQLPPLRERKEDIEALAQHFINIFSAQVKKKIPQMEPLFWEKLKSYEFRGNIRELRNIIERAIILCDGVMLTSDLLPSEVLLSKDNNKSPYNLSVIEKTYIQKVLQLTNGNKTKSAEMLGIGVTTLYRKLEEYGIDNFK